MFDVAKKKICGEFSLNGWDFEVIVGKTVVTDGDVGLVLGKLSLCCWIVGLIDILVIRF